MPSDFAFKPSRFVPIPYRNERAILTSCETFVQNEQQFFYTSQILVAIMRVIKHPSVEIDVRFCICAEESVAAAGMRADEIHVGFR